MSKVLATPKQVERDVKVCKKIAVFGDSLLKGVQINPQNTRYHVNNNIAIEMIAEKHLLEIKNYSKFGLTITKGAALIKKRLNDSEVACDAIIMDYGGNDCDFDWKAISERPDDEHMPNTPIDIFVNTYHKIIEALKAKDILPILTNLPPLDARRFFHWFCNGLNKENVLKWLGGIDFIYRWQESYSRAIEKIAVETNALIVDLRGAFLTQKKLEALLCDDGVHPNTEGQKIITHALLAFFENAKIRGDIII